MEEEWKLMEIGGTTVYQVSRFMEVSRKLDEASTGYGRGSFHFASTLLLLLKVPLACTIFQSGNIHLASKTSSRLPFGLQNFHSAKTYIRLPFGFQTSIWPP